MPERWRTEQEKLKQTFGTTLRNVWEIWDNYVGHGTPFGDLDDLQQSDIETRDLLPFTYDVGWLRGVSEAAGWSLVRPMPEGPKEWRPGKGKPPK